MDSCRPVGRKSLTTLLGLHAHASTRAPCQIDLPDVGFDLPLLCIIRRRCRRRCLGRRRHLCFVASEPLAQLTPSSLLPSHPRSHGGTDPTTPMSITLIEVGVVLVSIMTLCIHILRTVVRMGRDGPVGRATRQMTVRNDGTVNQILENIYPPTAPHASA